MKTRVKRKQYLKEKNVISQKSPDHNVSSTCTSKPENMTEKMNPHTDNYRMQLYSKYPLGSLSLQSSSTIQRALSAIESSIWTNIELLLLYDHSHCFVFWLVISFLSSFPPAILFAHRPPHALEQYQAQHPEMVHPAQHLIKSDGNKIPITYFKTLTVNFLSGEMSSIIYWNAMPIWIRSSLVGLLRNIKRFVT